MTRLFPFSIPGSGTWLAARLLALGLSSAVANAAFVYETPTEFLTSGDFNGDGVSDALVLDKLTGNARVGYADPGGGLTWSAPLVTAVENVAGCAVGRLLQTTRDAVAATAPSLNRIQLVDLSRTNTAGLSMVVTPTGIGPRTLAVLPNPPGGAPPPFPSLLAASGLNSAPAERLDLMSLYAGAVATSAQFAEVAPFERGNALPLSTSPGTFAVGLARGAQDRLRIWQFTNSPAACLTLSNLPPGGDYVFGRFNGENLPRFAFYVPGQSNITLRSLIQTNGGLAFDPPITVPAGKAIQGLYYTDLGTDGSLLIHFGDGVRGLRLPGGSPALSATYSAGAGAAGNVFTGLVPLGNGRVAILDAPPGSGVAAHGQVVQFDGSHFTQLSATNLPAITARGTRANLWLFQREPFVSREPGFVASLNAADWCDGVSGLPGAFLLRKETDRGSSAGLGNLTTDLQTAPPAGSSYGLPNQYHPAISVFSYASPRAAEPVNVTISPPPGSYASPLQVSFSTLNGSDQVLYRPGAAAAWRQYSAPFSLTNDTTVQYYGTNAGSATRSLIQFASYSFGRNGGPTPTLNLQDGTSTTNPPVPPAITNPVVLSSVGTLFYGRRSPNRNFTIWSINLDGSGDTYITAGARPRVSRDGRYLAFLRGELPTQGNAWVRDLRTGQESLLYANTNFTIGYDWDLSGTNLIFDWYCWLWRINPIVDVSAVLPIPNPDCYDDAPAVNPVDGRLAFHNLSANSLIRGLYLTSPDYTARQRMNLGAVISSWPAWSPNGQWISFADGNDTSSAFGADSGINLWVVQADGGGLSQITEFTDGVNGFPHGALWSPAGDALVGAGRIFGVNGLWIIPLSEDLSHCGGYPTLIRTLPGDDIDFAGSIIVASAPPRIPRIHIRPDQDAVVVYWSTNYPGYLLESNTNNLSTTWQPIPGPYSVGGLNFELRKPVSDPPPATFFRLHKP